MTDNIQLISDTSLRITPPSGVHFTLSINERGVSGRHLDYQSVGFNHLSEEVAGLISSLQGRITALEAQLENKKQEDEDFLSESKACSTEPEECESCQ